MQLAHCTHLHAHATSHMFLTRSLAPCAQVRYLSAGTKLTEEELEELRQLLCPWSTHDLLLGVQGSAGNGPEQAVLPSLSSLDQ